MKDDKGAVRPLRAGMTLSADIITRDRNLISFFSEPVKDSLDKAFKDPSDR